MQEEKLTKDFNVLYLCLLISILIDLRGSVSIHTHEKSVKLLPGVYALNLEFRISSLTLFFLFPNRYFEFVE